MKKLSAIAFALIIALSAAACGAPPGGGSPEHTTAPNALPPEESLSAPASSENANAKQTGLIIFAAASMTETLEEIAVLYAKEAPNVKLTFNFDSSGTLKTQIQEGAECDLFISAGQKQMDQLDLGIDETRIDLLENRVVLVVPSGNPANINSFNDIPDALSNREILMAMGNSDVPVGQYTQKIFEYFELDEQALSASGCISYGTNVKEVTTQVSEASADCGVIYCTDAYSAHLDIVDYATSEMCGRVVYPAAVLKTSGNPEAARTFLGYLTSGEAMTVFESVGFSKAA